MISSSPAGYQVAGPLGAPIVLDMFVDLLCPDCAAAWPNIQSVIGYYQSNISVNVHLFPLPYHTYAFVAARSGSITLAALESPDEAAQKKAYNEVFTWFFENQQQFWNDATASDSQTTVTALIGDALVKAGFITEAEFNAGIADDNTDENTRVSWKYACSRSVLGTPTFLVNVRRHGTTHGSSCANRAESQRERGRHERRLTEFVLPVLYLLSSQGVSVSGDPSWNLAAWRQVLDPLLAPPTTQLQRRAAPKASAPLCHKRAFTTRTFVHSADACPVGEPVCTYLPGKFECCLNGHHTKRQTRCDQADDTKLHTKPLRRPTSMLTLVCCCSPQLMTA